MLTYDLDKNKALYVSLYEHIKADIESGNIKSFEKLPSKRQLAEHLDISVITVQNAYAQLLSEGYITAKERSGYFAVETELILGHLPPANSVRQVSNSDNGVNQSSAKLELSLYKNTVNTENFPFSTWAKIMRQVLSENYDKLLYKTDSMGVWELRCAISDYLFSQRGMHVNPQNILIGAGTEYLYSIIIKLLGRDKTFGIENPCYPKIRHVYGAENIKTRLINLDKKGISMNDIDKQAVDILHISPSHQFPTGIVMPYSRRIELLKWAYDNKERYIIEDDYDSEFRFTGKPIPSLYHMDKQGKIIYMNTFSKTIAPSLRISYLILPDNLLQRFAQELSFVSNTVATFEQYTLARFIKDGYFERYIKKMKKYYKSVRDEIVDIIINSPLSEYVTISEEHAGLHFAMKLETEKTDIEIKTLAMKRGVNLVFMSDFTDVLSPQNMSTLILTYSDFKAEEIVKILDILSKII